MRELGVNPHLAQIPQLGVPIGVSEEEADVAAGGLLVQRLPRIRRRIGELSDLRPGGTVIRDLNLEVISVIGAVELPLHSVECSCRAEIKPDVGVARRSRDRRVPGSVLAAVEAMRAKA